MSDTAVARSGNWIEHVVTCNCGNCKGTWDLGLCDFWHPSRIKRAWWALYGKPSAKRRINKWNAHVATLES